MKNKQQVKARLDTDAIKYCRQIGIPWHQLPEMYWDKRSFQKRTGGRKASKGTLGKCSYWDNAILVDLDRKNPKNTTETLVHELVHLRWQKLPHGIGFEKRIKEVMRGQTFPLRERKDERPYYRIKLFVLEGLKGE